MTCIYRYGIRLRCDQFERIYRLRGAQWRACNTLVSWLKSDSPLTMLEMSKMLIKARRAYYRLAGTERTFQNAAIRLVRTAADAYDTRSGAT